MTPIGWAAAAPAAALVVVDDLATSDHERARVISGPEGHHLQRVRRIATGEQIVIADGTGRWYLARVVGSSDGRLTVERAGVTHIEAEPTPHLTIAFAPAKSDHGRDVLHQLVELGVDRIVPLATERSVVRWDGEGGARALERLRRVAQSAAVQCHRARIPVIESPSPVASVARRTGLVVAHRDGGSIDSIVVPEFDEWCVIVGPEGGFTAAEMDLFGAAPLVAIGPHVLRSVTAPVAIAAALTAQRTI